MSEIIDHAGDENATADEIEQDDSNDVLSIEGVEPFVKCPVQAMTDQRLSDCALRVYLAIRSHIDESKNGRTAFPGQELLAKMLGKSTRTVRRAIDELVELEYLSIVQVPRRTGGWPINHYTIRKMTDLSIEMTDLSDRNTTQVSDRNRTQMSDESESIINQIHKSNKNPPTPHTPPADLDAEWNEVWSWWPKHDSKHSARKAYRSQLRNYGQSRVEIMQGIKSFADHFVESGQKATFCPKLDSFLNDERWRDWADGPPKGHGPTDEELAKAADNAEYEAAKASVYARYPHLEPKWDDEGEQA